MAYEQDRGPGAPADPRYPAGHEARPGVAAGNTGTIAVIVAIVALFLGVFFFSGGAEQAVVPDATLPTSSAPTTGAPAPGVTPSAPPATETAPPAATPSAPPSTTAPAN